MLNLICSIPEEIGWVLVGAIGMVAIQMGARLAKLVGEMVKEYKKDEETY